MPTSSMNPAESALFTPKIFEESEKRRLAAAILAEPPRFRTAKAASLSIFGVMLAGVGLGILGYADLNSYHPEVSRLWVYVMAAVGAVTGSAALVRAVMNTRRLDAIATLIVSADRHNQ